MQSASGNVVKLDDTIYSNLKVSIFRRMAEAPAFQFDNELLNHIRSSRNTEAKSMLNEELAKAFDRRGNLLHLAVYYNNTEILEHLMELGSDINFRGQTGTTPLMIAVQKERLASTEILLNAGADIDLVNNGGISALKMVLQSDYFNTEIVTAFLRKLRDRFRENEDLVENLISTDAALHHVMLLRDFKLVADILTHETWERTSVENEGRRANRDVRDVVEQEKVVVSVRLVPRQVEGTHPRQSPIVNLVFTNGSYINHPQLGYPRSLTLLPQHYAGTIQQNGELLVYTTIKSDRKFQRFSSLVYDLIAYLTMMEKSETPLATNAFCYKTTRRTGKDDQLESYHKVCERMLDTIMHDNLTLFVLITDRHNNMRNLVRNQTFERMIREACVVHQLNEQSFAYYYNALTSRIQKANHLVPMEDAAIDITISNIFDNNHNKFYHIAKQIISNLNESDIERLCNTFQ